MWLCREPFRERCWEVLRAMRLTENVHVLSAMRCARMTRYLQALHWESFFSTATITLQLGARLEVGVSDWPESLRGQLPPSSICTPQLFPISWAGGCLSCCRRGDPPKLTRVEPNSFSWTGYLPCLRGEHPSTPYCSSPNSCILISPTNPPSGWLRYVGSSNRCILVLPRTASFCVWRRHYPRCDSDGSSPARANSAFASGAKLCDS